MGVGVGLGGMVSQGSNTELERINKHTETEMVSEEGENFAGGTTPRARAAPHFS